MPKHTPIADSLPPEDHLETGSTGIIGYRLRRAQLAVFQKFHAAFETLSLRPADYSVLTMIADNPGRMQTEIAKVLGIKRANFVTLVHGLEARGLVQRVASQQDRRANALHLTAEGQAFLWQARDMHERLERETIDQLGGPEEGAHLLRLLDRLR